MKGIDRPGDRQLGAGQLGHRDDRRATSPEVSRPAELHQGARRRGGEHRRAEPGGDRSQQLQIDSALDSITRIANTENFAGLRLLDGSMEYITSGLQQSDIKQATIFSAQFGDAPNAAVNVEVIASAQTAGLFLSGNTTGSVGALMSSLTLEISGNEGVQSLRFVSGTTLSAVAAAVNTVAESTGVSATLASASDQSSGLVFNSTSYGSDQFVSVKRIGPGGNFLLTGRPAGGQHP